MTREQQRQIGALKALALKTTERGESTLSVTAHADEVLMEHLALAGTELFKDYDAETRRRMAKAGHALPDGSFPIANCTDASNAIRSVGRAAPAKRGKVRSFIRRRVKALGCKGSIFEPYQ